MRHLLKEYWQIRLRVLLRVLQYLDMVYLFTHVYLYLLVLPNVYDCLLVHVYLYLPMITGVYLC